MTQYAVVNARDDVRIETRVELPLQPGTVRVGIAYAGICGSDLHHVEAPEDADELPWEIGHEYSGVVEEVASDVRSLRPGDRVVCRPRLPCRRCVSCRSGRLTQCENFDMRL